MMSKVGGRLLHLGVSLNSSWGLWMSRYSGILQGLDIDDAIADESRKATELRSAGGQVLSGGPLGVHLSSLERFLQTV